MRISRIILVVLGLPLSVAFRAPCKSVRIPSQRNAMSLEGVDAFFQAQPFLAAFMTCSFKASAADLTAQSTNIASQDTNDDNKQEESFDFARNLAFFCYGGFWQGMFQQFLFTMVYPHMFGTEHTWASIAPQVAFDTILVGPLAMLPVCYSVKTMFASNHDKDNDSSSLVDNIRDGLQKYHQDVTTRGLLQLFWSIWIPAQFLTFGVIPSHLRVVFVAMVSFFWVCALSTISSTTTTTSKEKDEVMTNPQPMMSSRPEKVQSFAGMSNSSFDNPVRV